MKKQFLITTTDSFVNGIQIEKYIDLVQSNVVLGTNAFSDFKASFTDVFGGFSNTYQRKLGIIRQAAVDDVIEQARRYGANAIVGLKMDFDEVSGSKNSMFMVSVIGTAVKVSMPATTDIASDDDTLKGVSLEELNMEQRRREIIARIETGESIDDSAWAFLKEAPVEDMLDVMLEHYIKCLPVIGQGESDQYYKTQFEDYLHYVNIDMLSEAAYKLLPTYCNTMRGLFQKNNIFSPSATLNLLNAGQSDAALVSMRSGKEYYSESDIAVMGQIVAYFDNLPDLGHYETRVKGLVKKQEVKIYVCPEGHTNDVGFCFKCGRDIKGLTEAQANVVARFKGNLEILKEMLA